ncbi:MAG TPA: transglutaminase family protein [Caulobacteraceae bacterium]|jgi:transglutaminase-like putative cysteine protease
MLFDIRHVTEYAYDEPVRESVMELWMQPRSGQRHRLISFELDVDPPAQILSYADSFGNSVKHFDVPFPHRRLSITAHSVVEAHAPSPQPQALGMDEWAGLSSDQTKGDCWDFLRPHGFAAPTEALEAFCRERGVHELKSLDPLAAVRELNAVIYRGIGYQSGVTAADSPIDEALLAGRGVCQDFAHIMLAICRGWGVPARYVSGYLATRQDEGDRSDPLATHAWVEVFLPSTRWVGFDPTNNTAAGERHIPVAIGRDYSDVPPSRGVFKGDAESQLFVGVSVRPTSVAPEEPEFLKLGAPAIAAARRRATSHALMDQHYQQQQ